VHVTNRLKSNSSNPEDDVLPIALNGAEQADLMCARLGRAHTLLQAALDDLSTQQSTLWTR
jgi:hypothetical protein